jgi:S1-C subfamily serine protease
MESCFTGCVSLLRLRVVLLAAALAGLVLCVSAGPAAAVSPTPQKAQRAITTGIVDIFTTLGYQSGEAAGTGMIVDANGEVLTNNHVIRGATVFKVVDVTTRKTYTATVVGYSVKRDVAVLKLANARSLGTIAVGNSSTLKVGQRVAALGNALGAGTSTPASGRITALGQSLTAYDESGSAENLTGMIETDAGVRPGDSGGPLFNASWKAIGMVTAGSSTLAFHSSGGLGYAIPINRALALAKQIWTGQASAQVHVGPTAFLGVRVQAAPSGGALISQVISGTGAEAAGLVQGDVITSLNGVRIDSPSDLTDVVLALRPGAGYSITWIDASGTGRTAQISPQSGPPQ